MTDEPSSPTRPIIVRASRYGHPTKPRKSAPSHFFIKKEKAMITLCIRYAIDPNKLADFKAYASSKLEVIRRSGGDSPSFFYPTDSAGPTSEALGLMTFETLAAYEKYCGTLASDQLHNEVRALEDSGVITRMNRSIVERVKSAITDGSQG